MVPPRDETGSVENIKNWKIYMKLRTIKLTVNGKAHSVTLAGNTSAEALVKSLLQGPLSVTMDDYGDMEKVGALGFTLPRNDMQTATSAGDMILYQGRFLVLYYDRNSWNFTRMGKVDGITSRQEMLDLLGGAGEVVVTLSL